MLQRSGRNATTKIYLWRSFALKESEPKRRRGTFRSFGGPQSLPFGSEWTFPTSELIEQSRPTRCPKAEALSRDQSFARFVFAAQLCTAFSDTLRRPYAHPASTSSKAGTTSPDQPATSSLPVNSPPGLLGLTITLGAHLRPAIGRKPAVPWETCSIEDPSGVINKRQNKQAICAFCSALCSERALLAPVSAGRTWPLPGPALRNFC